MLNYLKTKEINNFKLIKLKKDEILFHEGDVCHFVYLLIKGQIIIKSYTSEGKVIIHSIINQDEMFGNNLLFSSNKKYKGNVVASKDAEIYEIDENAFLKILSENKAFLKAYLNLQAKTIKEFNNKIKILSIDSAKERFMFYLKVNNNSIAYTSITSLAKELGLTRESTSRLINKLIKEKIISSQDKTIKLL